MQITINLDEEDALIAKSIVANQTHFCLNSECLEDAVITGILHQIANHNSREGENDAQTTV